MVSIRALTPEDEAALAAFSCGQIEEAWSDVVERMVQRDLPIQIASERGFTAIGLWDGDELCGVAAWKIFDAAPPILCQGILQGVTGSHGMQWEEGEPVGGTGDDLGWFVAGHDGAERTTIRLRSGFFGRPGERNVACNTS